MNNKKVGLTEEVWNDCKKEEKKLAWRIFVGLFSLLLNYLIAPPEQQLLNIVVATIITLYLVMILNAERGYSKISHEYKKLVFAISWMVPTFIISSLVLIGIVYVLYAIGFVTFEVSAAPVVELYSKPIAITFTGLAVLWAFKIQFIDSRALQTFYQNLSNSFKNLFSKDGSNDIVFFVSFEVGTIVIGTALTHGAHGILNIVL